MVFLLISADIFNRTTKLRFCIKVDFSKPCKHFQSIFNNEQSFTKISIVVVEMARSHSIKEKKKKIEELFIFKVDQDFVHFLFLLLPTSHRHERSRLLNINFFKHRICFCKYSGKRLIISLLVVSTFGSSSFWPRSLVWKRSH